MLRAVKFFTILALSGLVSLRPSSASPPNEILNIRHWVAPDYTRVVVDTSQECNFTVEKEERRIVVDLEATSFPSHIPPVNRLSKPGVETVTVIPLPPSGVRVELTVPSRAQTSVFKLKKFQDKPDRIVIDIVLPEVAQRQSEAREKMKIAIKKRIVVIDPGHGGDAPGAVGKRGTLEKDVVLSISKKLRDILNGKMGYRAFLTRDGDYYVSFGKRLKIAREYGADLFVSIHADAAKNRDAGGSSVYCFSTDAVSSEAAKILAHNENLADIVGGAPAGEGSDDSDPVILDMFQTRTINQSKTLAFGLLKHLESTIPLKYSTVQEAPFRVLKLPEIPSVLIETAFISNEQEEKLLRSNRFRLRIAEMVARSVVEFLTPLPPASVEPSGEKDEGDVSGGPHAGGAGSGQGSGQGIDIGGEAEPAAGKNGHSVLRKKAVEAPAPPRPAVSLYRVRKGDTLGKIAVLCGTSIGVLLELNGMRVSDPLYVGRLLKVPGKRELDGQAAEGKRLASVLSSGRVFYRVKRGDTLSKIARSHGTTIAVLMALNRLKGSELLPVDRKLILPAKSHL